MRFRGAYVRSVDYRQNEFFEEDWHEVELRALVTKEQMIELEEHGRESTELSLFLFKRSKK